MHRTALVALTCCLLAGLSACSTVPESQEERTALHERTLGSIQRFKQADPVIGKLMEGAAGYAVFPSVGKGAVGIGAAWGRGEVFDKAGKVIGYCDLGQATIGLALGGQEYSEIILFQDQTALSRFKEGRFAIAAQASAIAAGSGLSDKADYENGLLVFTQGISGLMYEASIGGQKFNYVATK